MNPFLKLAPNFEKRLSILREFSENGNYTYLELTKYTIRFMRCEYLRARRYRDDQKIGDLCIKMNNQHLVSELREDLKTP